MSTISVAAQVQLRVSIMLFALPLSQMHAQENLAATRHSLREVSSKAAPKKLMDMIERGKVRFEFYEKQPRKFPGETHFQFHSSSAYRFTSVVKARNSRKIGVIRIRTYDVKVECENRILLPAEIRGENFWENALLIHEFEHVRLNCDQRPKLLAEHLLERASSIEVPLQGGITLSDTVVKQAIDDHFASIRQEISRIMQANNELLDELTLHGVRELEDSEAFFGQLYCKDNLAALKFRYLNDVADLLRADNYRELN